VVGEFGGGAAGLAAFQGVGEVCELCLGLGQGLGKAGDLLFMQGR
jgi:hypothetical protein